MINKIQANHKKFKEVLFKPGMNLILADKSDTSDEKDSRNGLGKTSLIEIVHFCLGADFNRTKVIKKKELTGWEFTLDFNVRHDHFIVSRSTDNPNIIQILKRPDPLFPSPSYDEELGFYFYNIDDWNKVLGKIIFNLSITSDTDRESFKPTFRGLFPYFARKGLDAYSDPFAYFKGQNAWQRKIYNAFLLNLSIDYSRQWQILKDKEETIDSLIKASKAGMLESVMGSIGELEAHKTLLENKVIALKQDLETFQIHPQYYEIEKEANKLTMRIHELSNQNISDRELLSYYELSISNEKSDSLSRSDIEDFYKQIGIYFSDQVKKRIDDVEVFNKKIVEHRESFLLEEMQRLKNSIVDRQSQIKRLSEFRSKQMEVLQSHKALEAYNKIQNKYTELMSQIEQINYRIQSTKDLVEEKDNIKIQKVHLQKLARKDYEERNEIRQNAINIFNSYSEFLYESPGSLVVNVEDGYKFSIDIQRSESDGFTKMKIFCYDLTIARLCAERNIGPDFLIHDSSIFADVDERQVAKAISLAAQASENFGFQYIAFLNTNSIPDKNLFDKNFDLDKHIVLELKDHPETDCLFGFRF